MKNTRLNKFSNVSNNCLVTDFVIRVVAIITRKFKWKSFSQLNQTKSHLISSSASSWCSLQTDVCSSHRELSSGTHVKYSIQLEFDPLRVDWINACFNSCVVAGLRVGSCWTQSIVKRWKDRLKHRWKADSSLASIWLLAATPSKTPESAAWSAKTILCSVGGIVLQSQICGGEPSSLLMSNCVDGKSTNGAIPLANSHAVMPRL